MDFDKPKVFGDTSITDGLVYGGSSIVLRMILDKAPRLSISIVIWILPSDTETSAATLWEGVQ